MRNCLIVLVVLVFCFFAAVFLLFAINTNFGRGFPGGMSLTMGEWRDYNDPGIIGLEVVLAPDEIIVDIPTTHIFKQVTEKGHWNLHGFYCDSHVDSPPEVEVAHELANEDLVVDIGRFVPGHPGKVTLVKVMRGAKGEPSLYPVYEPGQTVTYPPPKGMIREGMLECDLETLPWRADRIDVQSDEVHVDMTRLSDGSPNRNYFADETNSIGNIDENAKIYSFHSDRDGVPKLLVTVYHGRVTEVTGGAEETADIPWQLPAPAAPADVAPARTASRTWGEWLFDLVFTK